MILDVDTVIDRSGRESRRNLPNTHPEMICRVFLVRVRFKRERDCLPTPGLDVDCGTADILSSNLLPGVRVDDLHSENHGLTVQEQVLLLTRGFVGSGGVRPYDSVVVNEILRVPCRAIAAVGCWLVLTLLAA